MAERLLLDACAMIAYLNDEEGAGKVEELLWQSNQGFSRFPVSQPSGFFAFVLLTFSFQL